MGKLGLPRRHDTQASVSMDEGRQVSLLSEMVATYMQVHEVTTVQELAKCVARCDSFLFPTNGPGGYDNGQTALPRQSAALMQLASRFT